MVHPCKICGSLSLLEGGLNLWSGVSLNLSLSRGDFHLIKLLDRTSLSHEVRDSASKLGGVKRGGSVDDCSNRLTPLPLISLKSNFDDCSNRLTPLPLISLKSNFDDCSNRLTPLPLISLESSVDECSNRLTLLISSRTCHGSPDGLEIEIQNDGVSLQSSGCYSSSGLTCVCGGVSQLDVRDVLELLQMEEFARSINVGFSVGKVSVSKVIDVTEVSYISIQSVVVHIICKSV
jgi:hypothetical protein